MFWLLDYPLLWCLDVGPVFSTLLFLLHFNEVVETQVGKNVTCLKGNLSLSYSSVRKVSSDLMFDSQVKVRVNPVGVLGQRVTIRTNREDFKDPSESVFQVSYTFSAARYTM